MSTRKIIVEYVNGDKSDCATFTVDSYLTVHTFVDSSGNFHVLVDNKTLFICAKLIAFSNRTDNE